MFKFGVLLRELLLDDPLAIFDAKSESPRAHALLVADDVHLKFGQGSTLGGAFRVHTVPSHFDFLRFHLPVHRELSFEKMPSLLFQTLWLIVIVFEA